MDLLQAVVLGIIQGLTEFLPISSSGHLVIAHWLFGWQTENDLAFDVALHIGTLAAVITYFGRDFIDIGRAVIKGLLSRDFSDPVAKLGILIAIGTIPAAVAGLLLEKWADNAFRDPVRVAIMLILVSLLMLVAERVAKRDRDERNLGLADSLIIGTAQAVALIPGVSRSGITITAGLFRGLQRDSAARFSFLLATPITAAAALLEVRKLFSGGVTVIEPLTVAVGVVVAAVVGFLCIAFLLRFLARNTLGVFIVYRIAVGVIVLIVAGVRG